MLSSIASFLWGSKINENVENEFCSTETNTNSINDVISDVINNGDSSGVITPENALSTASMSDEEPGWVFVGKKKEKVQVNPNEDDLNDLEENDCETKKTKSNKKSNNSQTVNKSKNVPPSALHASSVLSALAELKPQQRVDRRQRELRLKHKQMERSNKSIMVKSSSNKPSRRRFLYTPELSSRAVNNRKC